MPPARIKSSPRIKDSTTVIMVTSYGREEFMFQARDAGIEGYLVKPVSRSVLFDTIMDAFGQEITCGGGCPDNPTLLPENLI